MAKELHLDKLSLEDLKVLSKDIEAAIKKRAADNLRTARLAVEAIAKEHGFSLEEIVGMRAPRLSSREKTAKYRNPNDLSQTWSGRGRQPQWFKDALSAGRKPEDLAA